MLLLVTRLLQFSK